MDEVCTFAESNGCNFIPSQQKFLFGFLEDNITTFSNFVSLVMKKYISLNKFKSANMKLVGFRSFLKTYVVDLCFFLKVKNMPEQLVEWEEVLNFL